MSLARGALMLGAGRRGLNASVRALALTGGGAGPAPPAGASVWLKADALVLANGAAVATWPDSSGNAKDAAQATAGKRPTFVTNFLNGKPTVRFDGTDDRLVTPNIDLSGTDDVTFAWVGCPQTSQGEVAMIHFGAGAFAVGGFAVWPNVTSGRYELLNGGLLSWGYLTTIGVGVSKTHVVTIDRALVANEIIPRTNGAAGAFTWDTNNDTSGNNTNAPLYLGARPADDLFSSFNLCELLIYPTKLSAGDIATLETYLRARYATW